MKTFLLFLLAIFLLAFALHAASDGDVRKGVWTADVKGDRIHLSIFRGSTGSHRGTNMMGFGGSLSDYGLSRARVESEAANVTFAMEREAGRIAFEGRFATGDGAGQYHFTPSERYEQDLNALGYDAITDNEMMLFTVENLALDTLRGLAAAGRKPTRAQLDEVAVFRVTPQFLRELASLGYPDVTLREAVEMRVGKVDATFIQGMRAAGVKDPSAHEIAEMGILRVTPDYVEELRKVGYRDLTPRQLIEMKVMNVTPEYIRSLKN